MVVYANAKADATRRYLHGNWQAPLTKHRASCHGFRFFGPNQIQRSKLVTTLIQILVARTTQGKFFNYSYVSGL